MPPRQRLGLLVGIALLTCGAVLLEVGLHRTYVALFGHDLALLVLPAALLGAGLGGVGLYLAPGLARPRSLFAQLGNVAALAATAAIAALLVIIQLKAPETLDRAAAARLLVVALAVTVPFVPVGVGLAAAFRCAPRDAGRLGFAVFGAAALTGPLAVVALRLGAPRLGLFAAIVDALGALAFYLGPLRGAGAPARPRGGIVATVVLASCVLLAGDSGAPWLKLPALRWTMLDKVEAQEWSVLGLLTVDKPIAGNATMRTDGTFGSPILDGKTVPPVQSDELSYALQKEPGPVLVLQAGGGRDVRVALKFGQREVRVVEPDALVVRAMLRDRYKKFSGDLYDKPDVTVDIEDARGFLERTRLRFHDIVLALPDAQAPAAIGALDAEPNELYTVEAFRAYLDKLAPDGTLVVTRWDTELDRLVALAAEALRERGEAAPATHMYACGAPHTTTLLVRQTPFSARDVATLRGHCRKSKMAEAFSPDVPRSELRRRLTAAASDPDLYAAQPVDLAPPTDDRPFFGAAVPAHRLRATLRDLVGMQAAHHALLVLAGLMVVALAALTLALAVPVLARPVPRGGHLGPLYYFGAVGAALALTLAALAARLPMLLGHPGHALATVLVAFFGFAAGGSLLVGRVARERTEAAAGRRAQLLVAMLAACAAFLDPLVRGTLGLPFAVRLAVALALLAPLGMLLGALLPLGVALLKMRAPDLVPWCIGAGALGAFAASIAAVLVAMMLGYGAVLLAAGAACLLAAAVVPRPLYVLAAPTSVR